jgi:uncharacterized protein with GYD domain
LQRIDPGVIFPQEDASVATYVILSRFSPEAFDDPKDFTRLAEQVSKKIKSECPGVQWRHSYATLGRFDVVDIVESDDMRQVERAAMIIRGYGHSTTDPDGNSVDRVPSDAC